MYSAAEPIENTYPMLSQEAIQAAAERLVAVAHSPVKVILFGSYARGNPDASSDIDLLVVESEIANPAEEYIKLHRAASEKGIGLDLLLMTESEFEKKRDWWSTPVYTAIREGRVLYERT